MAEMAAVVMDISPQMAKAFLEKNTHNRPIRPNAIVQYARDMANGRWVCNGETIIIHKDGTIVDGQHRLMAIIRAGVTVRILVVMNAPDGSFETNGRGRPRTNGDIITLKFNEKKDGNLLAAAAAMLWRYVRGFPVRSAATSAQLSTSTEVIEIVQAHPGIRECIRDGRRLYSVLRSISVTPSVATFFSYVAKTANPEMFEKFIEQIVGGQNLQAGDPTFALRDTAIRRSGDREKLKADIGFGMLVKTWNWFIAGKSIGRIQFKSDEAIPDIAGCKIKVPKIR